MVVPPDADLERVNLVLEKRRRFAGVLNNPGFSPHLKRGEAYCYLGGVICDCGTALGSLNRNQKPERTEKKQLDLLRKKGWGESKIARWMEQKKSIQVREEQIQKLQDGERGHDPDGWCATIGDILEEADMKYFGLYLHFYSEGLETEKLEPSGRIELLLNDQLADTLFRMKEDVLHVIRKA